MVIFDLFREAREGFPEEVTLELRAEVGKVFLGGGGRGGLTTGKNVRELCGGIGDSRKRH